jgi:hypothetical protein
MKQKISKIISVIFFVLNITPASAQYSSNFYGDCVAVTAIQWNIALGAPGADKSDKNIKRLSDTMKLFQEIQIQYYIKNGAPRQSAINSAKNYKGQFFNHMKNPDLVNSSIDEIKNQIQKCSNSINQDPMAKSVLQRMDF